MTLLDLDRDITYFLYQRVGVALMESGPLFSTILFALAAAVIYSVPIVLGYLFLKSHQDRLRAIKIALAGLIAWQGVSRFLGEWLYLTFGFRDRPFADRGIVELFFEHPQKAFPSDHASVLAAVALGLILYRYPKLAWIFLVAGITSSLARVMIGFHWFGDIVVGWLIGFGSISLVYLLGANLDKIFSPLLAMIEKRLRCPRDTKE